MQILTEDNILFIASEYFDVSDNIKLCLVSKNYNKLMNKSYIWYNYCTKIFSNDFWIRALSMPQKLSKPKGHFKLEYKRILNFNRILKERNFDYSHALMRGILGLTKSSKKLDEIIRAR